MFGQDFKVGSEAESLTGWGRSECLVMFAVMEQTWGSNEKAGSRMRPRGSDSCVINGE